MWLFKITHRGIETSLSYSYHRLVPHDGSIEDAWKSILADALRYAESNEKLLVSVVYVGSAMELPREAN